MSYSKKSRKEFAIRRNMWRSELGYQMEDEVERVIRRAVEEGTFASVVHHSPQTPSMDFTVTKMVNGVEESRSFGMTISLKVWSERRNRGGSPQFCFPIGTKPETIIRRVSELFKAV